MINYISTRMVLTLGLGLAAAAAYAQVVPSSQPATPAAAAQAIPDPAPRDPALRGYFDDFGGKAGLIVIVHDFMDIMMADPRTRPFFASVDREHVKKELVDQFCVILDGPCTYTGKNMVTVHKGLDINRTNFNALVEDLQKAMDKHDVPFHAQNKLLAKLAPMHRVIVTKPSHL